MSQSNRDALVVVLAALANRRWPRLSLRSVLRRDVMELILGSPWLTSLAQEKSRRMARDLARDLARDELVATLRGVVRSKGLPFSKRVEAAARRNKPSQIRQVIVRVSAATDAEAAAAILRRFRRPVPRRMPSRVHL